MQNNQLRYRLYELKVCMERKQIYQATLILEEIEPVIMENYSNDIRLMTELHRIKLLLATSSDVSIKTANSIVSRIIIKIG